MARHQLRDLHRVQPQTVRTARKAVGPEQDATAIAPDASPQDQADVFDLEPESTGQRRRRPDRLASVHRLIPPPPIDASSATQYAPQIPASGLMPDDRVRSLYGDESLPIDLEGEPHPAPAGNLADPAPSPPPTVLHATSASPPGESLAAVGVSDTVRAASQRRTQGIRHPPVSAVPTDDRAVRTCPSCEYDLRGTPEAIVCPECGATIPAGVRGSRHRAQRGLDTWSSPQLKRLSWGCMLMVIGVLGVFPAFPVYRYFMYLRSEAAVFLVLFVSVAMIGGGAWLAGIFSSRRLHTTGVRLPSHDRLNALLNDPMQRTAFCQCWAGRGFVGICIATAACIALITWHALSMRFSVTLTTVTTMLVMVSVVPICLALRPAAYDLEDEALPDRLWTLAWLNAILGSLSGLVLIPIASTPSVPVLVLSLLFIPLAWVPVWLATAWAMFRVSRLASWGVRYRKAARERDERLRTRGHATAT